MCPMSQKQIKTLLCLYLSTSNIDEQKTRNKITYRIHVWFIYLHLP